MRVILTDESIEVRLALWQKILGLMRDIRVPRSAVSDARVVENPVREAMGKGIKVGLRLPYVIYIARTLKLDEAFVVNRRAPGLSFAVSGEGPLRRVLVSTPEATELARRLAG